VRLRIRIKNQGYGIPSHEIDKIFSPYFRSSNKTKEEAFEHHGLGLYNCKRIISCLGGDLSVTSKIGHETEI
jgi:signal transduction histidine kinase